MILFFEFIKLYTKHGNKLKAFYFFFRFFLLLKVKLALKKISIKSFLFKVCVNSFPLLYYVTRSYSGRKYKIPVPIAWKKASHIAAVWLFKNLESRTEVVLSQKLLGELFDIYNNKGLTVKTKKQHHIQMFENKAFVRFLRPKKKKSTLKILDKKKQKVRRSRFFFKKLSPYALRYKFKGLSPVARLRNLNSFRSKHYTGNLKLPHDRFIRLMDVNVKSKTLSTIKASVPGYVRLPGVNKEFFYYGKTFRTKLDPKLYIRTYRNRLTYRFKGRRPLTDDEIKKVLKPIRNRKHLLILKMRESWQSFKTKEVNKRKNLRIKKFPLKTKEVNKKKNLRAKKCPLKIKEISTKKKVLISKKLPLKVKAQEKQNNVFIDDRFAKDFHRRREFKVFVDKTKYWSVDDVPPWIIKRQKRNFMKKQQRYDAWKKQKFYNSKSFNYLTKNDNDAYKNIKKTYKELLAKINKKK